MLVSFERGGQGMGQGEYELWSTEIFWGKGV